MAAVFSAGDMSGVCQRSTSAILGGVAGAQFEIEDLFTVMSVPRVGQVHLYYRARLTSDVFDPGHETLEARLFREDEIPWDELAFRTVRETLRHYFTDRQSGQFGVHAADIV